MSGKTKRGIFPWHLQIQVSGLVSRISYLRHYDALASFLCRAFGYTSMVGWAGAPQGAPV
ncbi:hypothetical protein CBI81_02745 [Salmonella enterica subsp. enterica serovar Molade]|nr:hypothetical protein [Salmonella enterica subsp. enterica serovar Molade]